MGFPILVRCHLYIESGPWYFTATFLQYSQQVGEGQLIVYYEHIGEKQPWNIKSFLYNRWHSIGCIVESCYTGTIPVIGSTNVTPSFIGKAHTQNDPWYDAFNFLQNINNSKGCCKEDATPLLMHWSYVFPALTHQTDTSQLATGGETINSTFYNCLCCIQYHGNGLIQDCSVSSALAMEILYTPSHQCYTALHYNKPQLYSTLT